MSETGAGRCVGKAGTCYVDRQAVLPWLKHSISAGKMAAKGKS